MPVYWLNQRLAFPDVESANPEGIVAVGGDYRWERILLAYREGIFPWSNVRDPILWWSPDPRFVLFPEDLRVQKSMRPSLRQRRFRVTYDTHFREVITACGEVPRGGQMVGTWISEALLEGYCELHGEGYAHSVEAWDADGRLVGGLYGVAIGRIFCGESMFALVPNASKYTFIHLVRNLRRRGYWLIDCQMKTDHLARFGASPIPRREYTRTLALNEAEPTDRGPWTNLMSDEALDDNT